MINVFSSILTKQNSDQTVAKERLLLRRKRHNAMSSPQIIYSREGVVFFDVFAKRGS